MGLTYVYSRLRVSLAAMQVSALFEESELGLEALADTLTTFVTASALSELYASIDSVDKMQDLINLCELSDLDIPLKVVLDEFHLLTKLVRFAVDSPEFEKFGLLRAVHLELPNTLILEYYTGLIEDPLPKKELSVVQFHAYDVTDPEAVWSGATGHRPCQN